MADHKCVSCQGKACQRCSSCQSIHYCSKECQKKDWPFHKSFCSLKYPDKDPKEKLGSVRAILLPAESPLPQFVEVPYKEYVLSGKEYGLEDEVFTAPDMELFLGDRAYPDRNMAVYKDDNGEKRVLSAYFRDNFFNDGSKPNQCVAAITKGINTRRWRGPMLVFRSDDVESVLDTMKSSNPQYVDMEKKDTKEVVTFFLEKKNNYYEGVEKLDFQLVKL